MYMHGINYTQAARKSADEMTYLTLCVLPGFVDEIDGECVCESFSERLPDQLQARLARDGEALVIQLGHHVTPVQVRSL